MLTLPANTRLYVATAPVDMRKSFDGLAAIISESLKKDVYSGQLFVFSNRHGDKLKIFYWDRNGYCYWYKRLERGVFRLPKVQSACYSLSAAELGLILEGIDLNDKQRLRAL